MSDPQELVKVRIKKVFGPTQTGTAVLIGDDEKTFVMYIGYFEGAALIRELNGEEPVRPFTHELLSYVLTGFDIEIKQVIISDIVGTTFCATLILEQKVLDESEQWVGKRNEVRIDARPSDCLVLACKHKADIWCARSVLAQVRDVSEVAEEAKSEDDEGEGFGKHSFKEMWDEIDDALGHEQDEDEAEEKDAD